MDEAFFQAVDFAMGHLDRLKQAACLYDEVPAGSEKSDGRRESMR